MIHRPNIPDSYAVFFTALDFTSISRHIQNWASFPLWLSLFILSLTISLLFPNNILDTYQPGGQLSFSVISFCISTLFMGFSRQEHWSGLPCPSPVDHVLSGTDMQGHALQPLHVRTRLVPWLPHCWSSLAVGCQSACSLKSRHISLA